MDIFVSNEPSKDVLSRLFDNGRRLVIAASWESATFSTDSNTVVVEENQSEFPFGIAFAHDCDDLERWLLNVARSLSCTMRCRSVYTGSPLTDAKPYHSIVFDHGRAFLADDSQTKLAGDGDRHVVLLRRVPELDSNRRTGSARLRR